MYLMQYVLSKLLLNMIIIFLLFEILPGELQAFI